MVGSYEHGGPVQYELRDLTIPSEELPSYYT
jgi:hypothetical protein